MEAGNSSICLDGLRDLLLITIALLVFLIVLAVFDLRDPNRKNRTFRQKKSFIKLICTIVFMLGFVGFYAYVNINPKIAVSEGTLEKRITRLISYKYYFDIGEPMLHKVTLGTFSAKDIVHGGLSAGARYRYYYEERTGELLGAERIAYE